MTKHQTLAYIKYGKLISEINDKITDSAIRSDIIKFLKNFPGTLKYPIDIGKCISCLDSYKQILYGSLIFRLLKLSYIKLIFDGKNNFKLLKYDPYKNNDKWITIIDWTSIDNIEYYVDIYLDDFNNIIE